VVVNHLVAKNLKKNQLPTLIIVEVYVVVLLHVVLRAPLLHILARQLIAQVLLEELLIVVVVVNK